MSKTKMFTLVSGVVFPLILLVMLTTFHVASDAARRTPDAPNFRKFAEPTSTKFESKTVYLYSPFLMQCIGIGIWGYWFVNRRRICEQRRYYLLPVAWLAWTFMLGVGGQIQASHALRAAGLPVRLPRPAMSRASLEQESHSSIRGNSSQSERTTKPRGVTP
jgi:hypothetical protein